MVEGIDWAWMTTKVENIDKSLETNRIDYKVVSFNIRIICIIYPYFYRYYLDVVLAKSAKLNTRVIEINALRFALISIEIPQCRRKV